MIATVTNIGPCVGHESFDIHISGVVAFLSHGLGRRLKLVCQAFSLINIENRIRLEKGDFLLLVFAAVVRLGLRYRSAWVPTQMDFHITPDEYKTRLATEFPRLPGTMFVPYSTPYDRRFEAPPPNSIKQELTEQIKKLRARKQK